MMMMPMFLPLAIATLLIGAISSGNAAAAAVVGGSSSSSQEENVLCPDKQSRCPEGTTCCQLSDGQYGCCPLPNAVCCADHLHCCPADTQCDVEHQRCLDKTTALDGTRGWRPFSRKIPASRANDGASQSALASAALSERRHPQQQQQNIDDDILANVAADSLPMPTEPAVRMCGGGGATKTSVCPRDSKCCRHKDPIDGSKSDSCCPFPNGQCCAHSPHCCPAGFACDLVEARCVNEQTNGVTLTTQMFPTNEATKKHFHSTSSSSQSSSLSLKVCPDGTLCGSPMDTCCPRQIDTSSSKPVFDCCPLSKANCCSGQFCCPEGHKCVAAVGDDDGVRHGGCQKMSVREKILKLFLSNNN